MELPRMKQLPMQTQTVEVFGGYNGNLQVGEGEFSHMENLTSDHYPVLSPRRPRGQRKEKAQALVSSHGLCRVENRRFLLPDGTDAGVELDWGEKQLVTMGAYVLVFPDKVWINIADTSERNRSGSMEASFSLASGEISLRPCRADGTVYEGVAETEPKSPTDGALWLDNAGDHPVLKQWSDTVGQWCSVSTGCVRLEATGIGDAFRKGDSVQVRLYGVPVSRKQLFGTIGEVTPVDTTDIGELRGTWTILEKTGNTIVFSGYLGTPLYRGTVELTATRQLPDMDLVVACGNRLWGCKYGNTKYGFVNEIYASGLGDFCNFHCFQGISTDSYAVSVGADGPFTGAASYMGRPVFFKENCMLEVYGSYPAEYRLQVTPCSGVRAGCHKSLAAVNNILYYKSPTGICAYDGTMPVQVGQALGEGEYSQAVAGGFGRKYYISLLDEEEKRHLYVYDTARGLWHREDSIPMKEFCTCGNTLYMLTEDGSILTNLGEEEGSVSWQAQTGRIGLHLPGSKYVSRLSLRMSVALGSRVWVYATYDGSDRKELLQTVQGSALGTVTVPLRPRRCDYMQLILEGEGEAKVYALTKTVERGGDGL